jgi:hypothetical protein
MDARREDRIPVDLNQPLVLSVHNPNGDVTVRAAERSDVLIGHVTSGYSGDPGDEEIDLMIDAHHNRIEVRARPHPGTGWAGISGDVDLDAVVGQITRAFRRGGARAAARPAKVRVAGRHAWTDITIDVPRAITGQFVIRSASGDVRIEGVAGELALNTMSGDLRAIRTSGELALKTASGDLAIEGATGRLNAQTASGDVRVTSAQSEGFHVQTASGDILVDALLTGDGPYRAQTASGDVRLTLRRSAADGEDPAATIAFHTVSGDAHVTPPFRKAARRRWQAGSGDSGPHIDVTTVSGDLVAGIAAAETAFIPAATPTAPVDVVPAAPPTTPTPPAPPAPVSAPEQPAPPPEPAPLTVSWPRGEVDRAATDVGPAAAQATVQDDAVRLAVLEAVERGEIDVEEALRRLEAADPMSSP